MNWNENEEQEPITTPDTENSTRINAAEGTDPIFDKNGQNKWDRMSGINTGAVDSFGNRNESVVRKQERAVAFDVIADHLSLTDVHHREGRELIMNDVDTQSLSRPGSSIHLICFCLAAQLVNRDNVLRSYHPARRDIDNDELFVKVQRTFDFDVDLINSFMQKLSTYV